MTAKILRARRMRDRYVFVIHLDITKVDAQGAPDERWVLRREWPLKETAEKTGYLAAIKAELQAAAVEQLARIADEDAGGIALPMEGATVG
jgi:hypothetical protein